MTPTEPRRAFIVHGHDIEALRQVEALLRDLGVEPVVLDSEVNRGRTLIEKLEQHADVDFGVVLLTPDDFGAARGSAETFERPRQNVVLELGYLMGRLGRSRVVLILRGKVEWPSDLHGLAHYRFGERLAEIELKVRKDIEAILRTPASDPEPINVFESTSSPEFLSDLSPRAETAQRITIVATGVNEPLMTHLMKAVRRAAAGTCKLELIVADPDSPAIETRLIEEESGDVKPPVGESGLRQRIDMLLDFQNRTENPADLSIRLFTSYPTFALLIFDDRYYFYPYGHAQLGTYSPVLAVSRHVPAHAPVFRFLDDHHRRVHDASLEAGGLIRARKRPGDESQLEALAVFYVPRSDSKLYRFGSRVLGFDVRQQRVDSSDYEDLLHGAAAFGFHLTLADVLFFPRGTATRMIIEELRFLARRVPPFQIVVGKPEPAFPAETHIALPVGDPEGGLEWLHTEFVTRIYRRALASLYTMPGRPAARDPRAEGRHLIIRQFSAPYVLGSYRPHFTLLDAVASEKEDTCARLRDAFREEGVERRVTVDTITVMSLRCDNRWQIAKEITLSGPSR